MAPIAVAESVFSTPKLLEKIILLTPPRTILVSAQRVCRSWRSVISTSPLIQQALFFQPAQASEDSEPLRNSLLEHEFPALFRNINPVYGGTWQGSFPSWIIAEEDGLRPALTAKEASWRKMLLTQPPIDRIGLTCIVETERGKQGAKFWLSTEFLPMSSGFTMELYLDTIFHDMKDCHLWYEATDWWNSKADQQMGIPGPEQDGVSTASQPVAVNENKRISLRDHSEGAIFF